MQFSFIMKYEYETANKMNYKVLKQFSIENRKYCTEAESILWSRLNNKQLGEKFRQQHIIGNYIADFVCLKKKLIIELDGRYHYYGDQQEKDRIREQILNEYGYKIIRFTNDELIADFDKVISKILEELNK